MKSAFLSPRRRGRKGKTDACLPRVRKKLLPFARGYGSPNLVHLRSHISLDFELGPAQGYIRLRNCRAFSGFAHKYKRQ